MNTKDIKEVKAGNVEIQRIMSGGGILWQKEIWHQINNPVDDYGDGFIFFNVGLFNKYAPFKTIKIGFSSRFISKHGTPTFSMNGLNEKNKKINSLIERNQDGTIITVKFYSEIARISYIYTEVDSNSIPVNKATDYLNSIIELRICIEE